jgi:hypothetical protein
LAPASGANLFHDAMDMILDGKFGEIQPEGNFLVRQTFRNQGYQLLLTER